jgi:hypothetical protein
MTILKRIGSAIAKMWRKAPDKPPGQKPGNDKPPGTDAGGGPKPTK